MATVFARLLPPTTVVVALLLLAALVVLLALLGGAPDTERLVGPFRWALDATAA